jgi:hypothetical protein
MTIREEYFEEARQLIGRETSTFKKSEDIMFTIFLRECFLSIRGDLNTEMKTKEGLYEKLVEIRKGVEDAWRAEQ